MRKVILTSYGFETARQKYNDFTHVIIETEHDSDPVEDAKRAERVFKKWFTSMGTDASLIYVSAKIPVMESDKNSGAIPVDDRFGSFTSETKPTIDFYGEGEEGNISDPVLIDIDGKRETFVVGKYFFSFKDQIGGWDVGEFYQSSLDMKNMRWSYLQLAKYDKG